MSANDQMQLDIHELVDAWRRELPNLLNEGDSVEVNMDGANDQVMRIHIQVAGHTQYALDFTCTYLDSREVQVELVDVEKDNQSVDEHTEVIQSLTEDYVRHIHECAQVLKSVTTA